ncbi:hypothetical protein BDD12DRAFT_873576 [Trichophaea hybrida]|nr:hypothetical protein BDD12DRAFT_873576 [Trichophaea hybrida]
MPVFIHTVQRRKRVTIELHIFSWIIKIKIRLYHKAKYNEYTDHLEDTTQQQRAKEAAAQAIEQEYNMRLSPNFFIDYRFVDTHRLHHLNLLHMMYLGMISTFWNGLSLSCVFTIDWETLALSGEPSPGQRLLVYWQHTVSCPCGITAQPTPIAEKALSGYNILHMGTCFLQLHCPVLLAKRNNHYEPPDITLGLPSPQGRVSYVPQNEEHHSASAGAESPGQECDGRRV